MRHSMLFRTVVWTLSEVVIILCIITLIHLRATQNRFELCGVMVEDSNVPFESPILMLALLIIDAMFLGYLTGKLQQIRLVIWTVILSLCITVRLLIYFKEQKEWSGVLGEKMLDLYTPSLKSDQYDENINAFLMEYIGRCCGGTSYCDYVTSKLPKSPYCQNYYEKHNSTVYPGPCTPKINKLLDSMINYGSLKMFYAVIANSIRIVVLIVFVVHKAFSYDDDEDIFN